MARFFVPFSLEVRRTDRYAFRSCLDAVVMPAPSHRNGTRAGFESASRHPTHLAIFFDLHDILGQRSEVVARRMHMRNADAEIEFGQLFHDVLHLFRRPLVV